MKHVRKSLVGAFSLMAAMLTAGEPAAEPDLQATDPRWEVGLFGAVGSLPHYRGSAESEIYYLPLPFLIYRGEIFEADRDGARGIFWKGTTAEMDFSVSGNPPVGDDKARSGMPDLDPLLEAGPALRVYIARNLSGADLYLLFALRGVASFSTEDLSPSYEGLRGEFNVRLVDYQPPADTRWKLGGTIGLDFASRGYNSYFYDVSASQVTAERPEYASRAGYGGVYLSGYAVRELSRTLSWSVYARWENIDGAVYRDSPLVKEDNNFVFGSALIWTFMESAERVRKPGRL